MNKLKTNWAPFPIEYSSCSSFTPRNFRWSKDEGIANVVIDRSILSHRGPKNKTYGWFCESSEILPDVKSFLLNSNNLENYFEKIFTCDYEIINKNPNFFVFNPPGSNLPWTHLSRFKVSEKTKICSMIASPKDMTSGHKKRIQVASLLKDKIDVYGGAAGTSRIGTGVGPKGDWWRSKEDALSEYMFSIVFENASYSNYYTEKITDCFALGVIPIYWGSPEIGKDFNDEGIIYWKDDLDISLLNRDLYESKKQAILENLERVKKMISADDMIYKKIKEWTA